MSRVRFISPPLVNTIMKKDRICNHCGKKFSNIEGRLFSNHVRWCSKNPDHEKLCGDEYKKKIIESTQTYRNNRYGEKQQFEVVCCKCGNKFFVEEYTKSFPQKERYFCSKSCACSYSASYVNPNNISVGRKKFDQLNPGYWSKNGTINSVIIEKCLWCGKEFNTTTKKHTKCCSRSCGAKHREFKLFQEMLNIAKSDYEKTKIKFKRYRQQCSFRFSLNKYPKEFDFTLIEKYGWYSASNHGGNLTGVSRDHMYSVKDGFLNNVDPKIISHPANCVLILQSDNASKRDNSSISLEELMERIRLWNEKYK